MLLKISFENKQKYLEKENEIDAVSVIIFRNKCSSFALFSFYCYFTKMNRWRNLDYKKELLKEVYFLEWKEKTHYLF